MNTPTQTNIFALALGDTLSPRVLLVSLLSFILTIVVFIGAIWLLFGGMGALSEWVAQSLQSFEGSIEQSWFLSMVSLIFITKTVVAILFFFTSAMVTYYLFLMVYSVIVGLFAGYFIKEIGTTYYPSVAFRGIGLLSYLWMVLKTLLWTTLMFLLLSPLVFIPVLNFALLVPVYYLFHKLLVLDVASMLNSTQEYRELKRLYAGQMRGISLVCFALTVIPFLGVVIYPYYVIVMSHFLFRKTKGMRAL
ncbi:EI24 domain-containing protein [Sulfurospirillum multivorans]|uniref:Membrane protein n=2 Tax=Sulfurospirillum multivorans TaxID=66821 RepID=A0AA86AJL8_SULMK|nr:EI24 domain-containing protein [Sulfurospirillum multivorans]AHJ11871.1 putative membrane protein [Sulfurospirillum multivorans DSM 12446]QEH05377.1 putative membrane protein [Sulfurospirillum multivorans]